MAETNGASQGSKLVLMREPGYHLFLQIQLNSAFSYFPITNNSILSHPALVRPIIRVTLRKVGTLRLTDVRWGKIICQWTGSPQISGQRE